MKILHNSIVTITSNWSWIMCKLPTSESEGITMKLKNNKVLSGTRYIEGPIIQYCLNSEFTKLISIGSNYDITT